MKLSDAILAADRLCPNSYTREEKLGWCNEVSAALRREVLKQYESLETAVSENGIAELPEGVSVEDIEVAYLDGKPLSKLDLRSFLVDRFPRGSEAKTLRLVVLTKPEPAEELWISGTFDVSENFIKMEVSPFRQGDLLEWVTYSGSGEPNWGNANSFYVLDTVYDGLMVEDDTFTAQTGANLAIRRVLEDVTEIDEAPYDRMYVEYILAKIALYQRDYTAYNAHISEYNHLLDSLRRDQKSRAPMNTVAQFRRYW